MRSFLLVVFLQSHTSRLGRGYLVIISALTIFSCRAVEELKPQRGIVAIPLEAERQLYFKREVRGLSYDLLTLSTDSDPCRSDDPAVDDVFVAQGPLTIYYMIEGGRLQVYSASSVTLAKGGDIRSLVEHHLLDPLDYQRVSDTYKQQGFTKLDVQLNIAAGRCR